MRPPETRPGASFVHGVHEDAFGILTGVILVSVGFEIYAKALLLTGGIAGLALLLDYVTPIGFWIGFFVLNLPFYWLAWRRKGRGFVVRTAIAIGLNCFLIGMGETWFSIAWIHPIYAALVGSTLIGVGLICLFRHGTSLGGIGILALCVQERFEIRAGYVQMAFDAAILLVAATLLPAQSLMLSILGAVATNGVLVVFHRSDRYIGVT